MSSHESVLKMLVTQLSTLKVKSTKTTATISLEMIVTQRALHYVCADRDVPVAMQQTIMKDFIPKLRFRETFFKVLDKDHLLVILESLVSKQRPDIHVPFDLLGGALFTTSNTFSALSAYGPIAPSPIDPSRSNCSITLRSGFTKGTTQGTLGGIPLFAKPIQQAVEDWKTLKKTGILAFQVKGKTNYGQLKIAGLGTLITDETTEGQQCHKLFVRYGKRADKKRSRDDPEDGSKFDGSSKLDPASEASHNTKKRKVATESAGMFDDLGW
jgi:hypothetical protein